MFPAPDASNTTESNKPSDGLDREPSQDDASTPNNTNSSLKKPLSLHDICTPVKNVCQFTITVCRRILPRASVWGSAYNENKFLSFLADYIKLGRYENVRLQELVDKLRQRDIPWLKTISEKTNHGANYSYVDTKHPSNKRYARQNRNKNKNKNEANIGTKGVAYVNRRNRKRPPGTMSQDTHKKRKLFKQISQTISQPQPQPQPHRVNLPTSPEYCENEADECVATTTTAGTLPVTVSEQGTGNKCSNSTLFSSSSPAASTYAHQHNTILLHLLLQWVFSSVINPLLATSFYITEGEGLGGCVLYYLKSVWDAAVEQIGMKQIDKQFIEVSIYIYIDYMLLVLFA